MTVLQERGEPYILLCATGRTRSSPLGALWPALNPERIALVAFSSGDSLPSATPATSAELMSGSFEGNTGPSDLPQSWITLAWA
jgi:hypothetical protein